MKSPRKLRCADIAARPARRLRTAHTWWPTRTCRAATTLAFGVGRLPSFEARLRRQPAPLAVVRRDRS
jgi:hypothetical protein